MTPSTSRPRNTALRSYPARARRAGISGTPTFRTRARTRPSTHPPRRSTDDGAWSAVGSRAYLFLPRARARTRRTDAARAYPLPLRIVMAVGAWSGVDGNRDEMDRLMARTGQCDVGALFAGAAVGECEHCRVIGVGVAPRVEDHVALVALEAVHGAADQPVLFAQREWDFALDCQLQVLDLLAEQRGARPGLRAGRPATAS